MNKGKTARSRALVRQLQAKGCVLCGSKENVTFHHVTKDKLKNVVTCTTQGSFGQLLREIRKCSLLCRDCHDRIHRDPWFVAHIPTEKLTKVNTPLPYSIIAEAYRKSVDLCAEFNNGVKCTAIPKTQEEAVSYIRRLVEGA